jgi:hypothetical protein
VGGRRGREIRRRARVRTRRSTVSAEGAELTGQAHGTERERRKGVCGATARRLAIRARETERERDRERERERERESRGEKNGCRQIGPTGQRAKEGGRARGRTAVDRRGLPVRRRVRAAWLGWA